MLHLVGHLHPPFVVHWLNAQLYRAVLVPVAVHVSLAPTTVALPLPSIVAVHNHLALDCLAGRGLAEEWALHREPLILHVGANLPCAMPPSRQLLKPASTSAIARGSQGPHFRFAVRLRYDARVQALEQQGLMGMLPSREGWFTWQRWFPRLEELMARTAEHRASARCGRVRERGRLSSGRFPGRVKKRHAGPFEKGSLSIEKYTLPVA